MYDPVLKVLRVDMPIPLISNRSDTRPIENNIRAAPVPMGGGGSPRPPLWIRRFRRVGLLQKKHNQSRVLEVHNVGRLIIRSEAFCFLI